MSKKILGIGNALVDILMKMNDDSLLKRFSLPKGTKQLVDKEFSNRVLKDTENLERIATSGGSAANTICGLGNLDINTGFIGKVCDDGFGKLFGLDLEKNNVTPHLLIDKTETGRAIALVSKDGERTFATYLGAAIKLEPKDILPSIFRKYDIVHVEGYLVQNHQLMESILSTAKENGLIVSLDLASFNIVQENLSFLNKMVKNYVDILFANEAEARTFTDMEPEESIHKIAKMCDIAIVKLGPQGSLVKQNETLFKIPQIKAKPIDTTGAGDLYASGFLYGIANDLSLDKAGKAGTIMATQIIKIMGAKIPDEKWDNIKREINEF